jgi:hypothetical protein
VDAIPDILISTSVPVTKPVIFQIKKYDVRNK